jgi:hypothetical protein
LSKKPATDKIDVHLKYKEMEKEFSATLEETWQLLETFFKEYLPSFEIAQTLMLNVDTEQLAKDLNGIVAFSTEGANLLVPKNKLTDNEALLIWLAAQYLGNKLGVVDSDSFSKEELQVKLGKSGKITSTRLGELVKGEYATKTADDRFKITTFGITQTQKEILPKVKAKTSVT